jgi:cytochrome c
MDSEQPLRSWKAHGGWIQALAVLPDGRFVSGSSDGTAKVWNPHSAEDRLTFEGHTEHLVALAVLPEDTVASVSDDRTVRLWSPGSCEILGEIYPDVAVSALAWVPSCDLLAAGDAAGQVYFSRVLKPENG